MDYEKKYKEALDRARKLEENSNGMILKKWLWNIFPELKESEDERIRKELLEHCKNQAKPYIHTGNECPQIQSWIAWLEKQGEQKPTLDFKAKDWYISKVDGKIHNMTYNPADKVEPKFKVGDFIVNDYCMGKVIELTSDAYLLDTGQGIPFSCEHNAHIWTIEDAKDGDVLMSRAPFIYGKQCPYGGLNWCNDKFIRASNFIFTDSPVHPATKEQRDILFQKMKEAGYEWDAERKELKKISQRMISAEAKEAMYNKPAWSEEDEKTLNEIFSVAARASLRKSTLFGKSYDYIKWQNWLKSLRDRVQPQPKQEWSEEDENILEDIKEAVINTWGGDTQDIILDWLKQLKQRIGG